MASYSLQVAIQNKSVLGPDGFLLLCNFQKGAIDECTDSVTCTSALKILGLPIIKDLMKISRVIALI